MLNYKELLFGYWSQIYPGVSTSLLEDFLNNIETDNPDQPSFNAIADWYKDAIVYSTYTELFNNDFPGLIDKLEYLQKLGVSCLWLLPVLSSPMRDGGFDIDNYYHIRPNLAGNAPDTDKLFADFLQKSHEYGIKVIFDISLNHISDEHFWFKEAIKSKNNEYRDFFIWSDTPEKYQDARIIFKGIEDSNWQKCGNEFYFHRFFNFQPDLNYRNPEVLLEMCRILLHWQKTGIDGFRADATPYIWKEKNTDCENLPQTHAIVKFFRAILDYVKPGTLLLAEACQKPQKVIEYLGNGDECHAAYHFPLMPRIFKAIAEEKSDAIKETLDRSVTPKIPANTQWFTFLRCHDELSLELVYVTEEERKFIHDSYCHKPEWDFRKGEGISARLAELMQRDSRRILLAYSLILTLPGTPVIYYGDEVGKLNDEEHYRETIKQTGKDDSRFLVRGKMNWNEIELDLLNPDSLSSKVFYPLQKMMLYRNTSKVFGRGELSFEKSANAALLIHTREYENQKYLFIHNLSSDKTSIDLSTFTMKTTDELGRLLDSFIEPYGFRWIKIS